jgi:hypothetical protein
VTCLQLSFRLPSKIFLVDLPEILFYRDPSAYEANFCLDSLEIECVLYRDPSLRFHNSRGIIEIARVAVAVINRL